MFKKISALLLGVLIVFQLVPAFSYTDTDDTEYEAAVNVLSELDIVSGYEDKTFRPAESITRAEFAAMVVRLKDTSVYTIPQDQIFTDVGKKHWAFEYVNAGYAMGYFSGYGDGTFNPDEKINFSEVVKTLVSILGYTPIAEAQGGYPSGYLKVANSKKLLVGLSLNQNQYVTRGDVALLVYNCLNKPKLEQIGFGSDSVEYTEDEKHTILTDELKIARYEGVVVATPYTGIYANASTDTNEILVGDVKLAVGKSDIVSYLGYNLVVYANEDKKTGDETVLFYEITDDNTVTTVLSEDIDPSTNLSFFSYWTEDKQKSEALSSDVQVIINAKYVPHVVSADLKPNSGVVTLLNNDGDKDIDVVIIRNYTHYVVEKMDETDLVIYDKYGKAPLDLEPEGKDVTYTITRNGSNAKFKNISVGAVLSVLKSTDGEYMEINIVISPVRGKVTGTDSDGNYIIGEESYKRSTDLPETEIIELGYEGTFYLDIEGGIIKVEASNPADGNYCYLLTAAKTEGLGGTFHMKILNAKGEVVTLKVSEKASFNGGRYSHDEIIEELGGETTLRQPLKYSLNEAGEINNIILPSLDFERAYRYYRRGTKMFGYRGSSGSFFISSEESVMFQVPSEGTGSDDSYKVISYDELANYNVSYSVTGYDLDGLTVGCAVVDVPEAVSEVEISGVCAVLTSVTQSVNEVGDPAYKLYYMYNGKKQESFLSDKVILKHYNIHLDNEDPNYAPVITPADLKPGDVFHFKLDSNDKINSVARVLSVGGTDLSAAPGFSVSRGFSAEKVFGRVEKRVDYGLLVEINETTSYLYDITKPSGKIYVYDSRNKTVTVGSANSILDVETAGDAGAAYVYVRCSSGVVGDVIVFYQSK